MDLQDYLRAFMKVQDEFERSPGQNGPLPDAPGWRYQGLGRGLGWRLGRASSKTYQAIRPGKTAGDRNM